MIKTILTCAALCAAMLSAGCNRDANAGNGVEAATKGVAQNVNENTYFNEEFKLTVTAPDGWFVADNEFTKHVMDAGTEVISSDQDARTKAMIDASVKRARNLFAFMEHPPGAPVDFNPSVMGVAENVGFMPGIKTGQDYFFHMRKLLEQTNAPSEVVGDYRTRKIGGQMFDRMDMKMTAMGQVVLQRVYAARHNEWVVVIVQSYGAEEDVAALDKVLDSMKLDW
jgi:hypothetical protein